MLKIEYNFQRIDGNPRRKSNETEPRRVEAAGERGVSQLSFSGLLKENLFFRK